MKQFIYSAAAILLLSSGCKKNTVGNAGAKDTDSTFMNMVDTNCHSVVLGFTIPLNAMYDSIGACSYGTINLSGSAFASKGTGTFASSVYTNQAAYSSASKYYYAFAIHMAANAGLSILYRIDSTGAATTLHNTGTGYVSSLVYNKMNNKLYGFSANKMVEVVTNGATFSTAPVANVRHYYFSGSPTTVDKATGNIYYVTYDSDKVTTNYYIECYQPGTAAPVTIASGPDGFWLYGLRFNKNDKMLYGVRENSTGRQYAFIKIDPAAGTITQQSILPFFINADFNSEEIDDCSNRYIIATAGVGATHDQYFLMQLNMNGMLLQKNTTPTMYMGLQIPE